MKTKLNFKVTVYGKRRDSLSVWLLFNIVRIVPNIIFGAFYFIGYFAYSVMHWTEYKCLKESYGRSVRTYSRLIKFFTDNYKYKYDGFHGLLDHDSSVFEWLWQYGDCDDAALYAKKALRKIGTSAWRIGIMPDDIRNCHFDCLFITNERCVLTYNLFNYGKVISAVTLDSLFMKLSTKYPKQFPGGKTRYCLCLH